MPQAWKPVSREEYPLPEWLVIDTYTGCPVQGYDEPAGCATHGTVNCAPCYNRGLDGALWEAPEDSEGTVRKRVEYGSGVVTGPARPAVTFAPMGSGRGALDALNAQAGRYDGTKVRKHWTQHVREDARHKLDGDVATDTAAWAARLGVTL